MAEKRRLRRLLGGGRLSGREVARLVLRNHMDELAGETPTFSEAEIGRARTSLSGRRREAETYNAWIEVPRIVEFVTMDALWKALEAEKALSVVILSATHLLRLRVFHHVAHATTKILTPEEWERFAAEREEARRARLAEERVSLGEVVRRRAWRLAPEGLKARASALLHPEEDEDRSGYGRLLEADEAAALPLRAAAEAEIVGLVAAGSLRFVRGGMNVTAIAEAGWRESLTTREAEALEAEAACDLLGLVAAGLPEWAEWSRAEHFTPAEFRGRVAVLTEAPPDCLGGAGGYVGPWPEAVEEVLRGEAAPERLDALRSMAEASAARIRAVLVRRAIIRVFGEEIGLDLVPPPLREREEVLRSLVAAYEQLAAIGRNGESDEDSADAEDPVGLPPRGLRLPVIDLEQLEPDPEEVERLRARLAAPDAREWWDAALELGVCGALAGIDPELKERLRQRGRELGSINLAAVQLLA